MKKQVQIGFIWIAAILLLAHQFVPHHHHEQGADTCETAMEHGHENEKNHTQVYELSDCFCDHNHDQQHTECDLEFKTIEKQQLNTFTLSVLLVFNASKKAKDSNTKYFVIDDNLVHQQFSRNPTLRGPPSIA